MRDKTPLGFTLSLIALLLMMLLAWILIGGLAMRADEWFAPYAFITVDGERMDGRYCGVKRHQSITCEDYDGHAYAVKEYWRTDE